MSRFLFTAANEYFALRKPLRVGDKQIEERAIVYFGAAGLDDPAFPQRTGEAAPLPGLHTETIDDVLDAFEGEAQDAVFADSLQTCSLLLADQPPSLRFALESIWLAWVAHQEDTVPARVLRADARDHVPVCALVEAEPDAEIPANASALKIKVGRRDPQVEHAALRDLLDRVGSDVEIRLDANRAWSLDEAVARLGGLDDECIAFVEEPLRDPAQVPAFHARTGLRVALDESLHEPERAGLLDDASVAAYVVKPSRCGIQSTLDWDARATASGKRVIVSSCFESGVGLAMLAQIAAALTSDAGPAGLGTARWLQTPPRIPGYDATTLRFAVDEWRPG